MELQTLLNGFYAKISPLLGNNVILAQIATGFLIFFVSFLIFEIFRTIVVSRLSALAKRTETDFDDMLIDAIRRIGRPLYILISAYLAAKIVVKNPFSIKVIGYIVLVAFTYYIMQVVKTLANYLVSKEIHKRSKKDEEAQTRSITSLVTGAINITLWTIAGLFLLSNFGFNITSLVAGLGIGGLAIGLALQGVFADLFATLSIYFDKPFKVGEFIIVGPDMGTVEHIGMKSTRIKTLQGQELTISNKELTNSRINNYARMQDRRIVFSLGIKCETKKEKLEKIPEIIRKIIEKISIAKFDRVHFKELGTYSLNYEIVYYVKSSDYLKYMDCQQEINLAIIDAFEKEGIGMAYPTQTLHLNK